MNKVFVELNYFNKFMNMDIIVYLWLILYCIIFTIYIIFLLKKIPLILKA